jgi:carbamoylphosphate synthase large subunit
LRRPLLGARVEGDRLPDRQIAAKLAGYTLDELRNDITRGRRPRSSRRSTTAW